MECWWLLLLGKFHLFIHSRVVLTGSSDSDGRAICRLRIWRYPLRPVHLYWTVSYQHRLVWSSRACAPKESDQRKDPGTETKWTCVMLSHSCTNNEARISAGTIKFVGVVKIALFQYTPQQKNLCLEKGKRISDLCP